VPFVVHEGGIGSFLQERERRERERGRKGGREGRAERRVVGVGKATTNRLKGTACGKGKREGGKEGGPRQ